MTFLKALEEIRLLAFRDNESPLAEVQLQKLIGDASSPLENRMALELMGLILRQQTKYQKAIHIYKLLDNNALCGYCSLLEGKLTDAQQYWVSLRAEHPTHWYIALFDMITLNLQFYPSLLQIRNHLESDISNLIDAKRLDYLENVLSYVDSLSQVNLEAPKLAGRALLHKSFPSQAARFLLLGQKILPSDPEVYYHLGQYNAEVHNYQESILMLKQCLLISTTYSPAAKLMNAIEQTLVKTN